MHLPSMVLTKKSGAVRNQSTQPLQWHAGGSKEQVAVKSIISSSMIMRRVRAYQLKNDDEILSKSDQST